MSKKVKFLTLSILAVLGRFYDVFTTFLYTPDLKHEHNIIVSWFGGGWVIVLIIQMLLTAMIIYCLHYYFYKFQLIRPSEPNLTLKEFVSYFHFNDKNSFWKFLYKTPVNRAGLIASIGYVAAMTLIFTSYIVGTSTVFLLVSDSYKQLYRLGIPYILYLMIVVLAIYFTIKFYKAAYKKYQYDVNA
jgi:hypothetical protein